VGAAGVLVAAGLDRDAAVADSATIVSKETIAVAITPVVVSATVRCW
jgi:hypothetical protein